MIGLADGKGLKARPSHPSLSNSPKAPAVSSSLASFMAMGWASADISGHQQAISSRLDTRPQTFVKSAGYIVYAMGIGSSRPSWSNATAPWADLLMGSKSTQIMLRRMRAMQPGGR